MRYFNLKSLDYGPLIKGLWSKTTISPSEHTLHTRRPHGILNVACEAERHRLRGGEDLALLEGHTQVNVHQLRRVAVDQDILGVTVTQAQDVTHWREGMQQLDSVIVVVVVFSNTAV